MADPYNSGKSTINYRHDRRAFERRILRGGANRFQQVKEEEKSKLVGNVFTNVASSYDIMNDVMSGGLHRLWKERFRLCGDTFISLVCYDFLLCVKFVTVVGLRLVAKLSPFAVDTVIAFRIFDAVNSVKRRALRKVDEASLEETQIYVCDINPNMLNVGKQRAAERGLRDNKSLIWVEGDAEALSFDDNSMDGYIIAFGIRNVTHIEKALLENLPS
ncbi:hypothetical protein Bca101_025181 [Brassica carinata]